MDENREDAEVNAATEEQRLEQGTEVLPPLEEVMFKGLVKGRVKKKTSNIGLDLGSEQIKMVQLRNHGGYPQLEKYRINQVPEGAVEEGKVEDLSLLSGRLRWMSRSQRFRTKRVNMCINPQTEILRQVFMPKMAPKELPNAVRWEAEKHIMMPLEDVVLDYFTLGERTVEGKTALEVVLVAVPKEVVNGYLQAVTRAGLYPEAVEIEALSLQRVIGMAFHSGEGKSEEANNPSQHYQDSNYLILDIGGDFSTLLFMERGTYAFSRTINTGTKHFEDRVAEAQGLDLEKSRRLVFGRDPFQWKEVQEMAEELLDQIQRSLEFFFYNMSHGEKEIDALLLCGGGVFIEELASFLEEGINTSTRLFDPLQLFQRNNNFDPTELARHGPLLGVASGLALRGWLR